MHVTNLATWKNPEENLWKGNTLSSSGSNVTTKKKRCKNVLPLKKTESKFITSLTRLRRLC